MSHGKRKFLTSLDFKFRCQISFIQMTSKQTSTQYREHMGLIMSFSQKGTEAGEDISYLKMETLFQWGMRQRDQCYIILSYSTQKKKKFLHVNLEINPSLFVPANNVSARPVEFTVASLLIGEKMSWKKMKYKSNESYLAVPSRSRIFGFISCLDDVNWPP